MITTWYKGIKSDIPRETKKFIKKNKNNERLLWVVSENNPKKSVQEELCEQRNREWKIRFEGD
jgi:hypothetical protein